MRQGILVALLLSAFAVIAPGQTRTRIVQTGYFPVEHVDYDIIPANLEIRLYRTNSRSFIFESRVEHWDGSTWVYDGPGDINRILSTGAGSGQISLEIRGGDFSIPGARDVRMVSIVGIMGNVNITGNLGADGLGSFQSVSQVKISGSLLQQLEVTAPTTGMDLTVGGNLLGGIRTSSLAHLVVLGSGPHTGAITLTDGTLSGTGIFIAGEYAGTMTFPISTSAPITIGDPIAGGSFTGTINVARAVLSPITINGPCAGTMNLSTLTYWDSPVSAAITVGSVSTTGVIRVGSSLTGSVTVNERLRGVLHIQGSATYGGGDALGPIHVGGSLTGQIIVNGALRNATLEEDPLAASAEITVGGNVTSTGSVTVAQSVQRPVTVTGTCSGLVDLATLGNTTYPVSGAVTVGGVASGGIVRVNSSLTGPLAVNQNLNGTVDIAGSPTYGGGNASGLITVGGDVGGSLHVAGQLTSGIRINGSLLNGPNAYDIDVTGGMGSSGAITVDYDGWHAGHDWASGATVCVNGTTYTGNTPGARVYEITGCKGDMDNDEAVNWRDIDPFVAAMNQGTNYDALYPGLAGSRVFHGDINCDNFVTWADIDPFIALMNGSCTLGCAGLEELELQSSYSLAATDGTSDDAGAPPPNTAAGAGYSPAQTAALLYDNTTPANRALLGYLIDQNAATAPTTDLQDYWQTVASLLPE
jgi:hypothetical protein